MIYEYPQNFSVADDANRALRKFKETYSDLQIPQILPLQEFFVFLRANVLKGPTVLSAQEYQAKADIFQTLVDKFKDILNKAQTAHVQPSSITKLAQDMNLVFEKIKAVFNKFEQREAPSAGINEIFKEVFGDGNLSEEDISSGANSFIEHPSDDEDFSDSEISPRVIEQFEKLSPRKHEAESNVSSPKEKQSPTKPKFSPKKVVMKASAPHVLSQESFKKLVDRHEDWKQRMLNERNNGIEDYISLKYAQEGGKLGRGIMKSHAFNKFIAEKREEQYKESINKENDNHPSNAKRKLFK